MADAPIPFGPYQLLRPLGQGAMGEVYLARPRDLERGLPPALVIKRLRADVAKEENFRRRFAHEAQLATSIDSPYVVKVFDAGSVAGDLYIAMEYIQGWPLSKVVQERVRSGSDIPIDGAADIIEGVLLGLAALHEAAGPKGSFGIVHRDLAPKNIMLGQEGRICLIDLGIGRSRLRAWKTRTGALLGSVGYMSPEQVRGESVDHRTDLYASGILLFEMLTLQAYVKPGPVMEMLKASLEPGFRPPSSLRPDLPNVLDELLEKALALDPKDRFQSAREFVSQLRAAIPKRGDGDRWTTSLVGELMWNELSRVETEVSRLFANTVTDPEQRRRGNTVVFAQRAGVQPAPGVRVVGPSQLSLARKAPLRGVAVALLASGAALIAALAIGPGLGVQSERETIAIESEPAEPVPSPGVRPVEQVREERTERSAQAPEPAPPKRREKPQPQPQPVERPTEKSPTEKPPEQAAKPAVPAITAIGEEDIPKLIDRASALRRRLPKDTPDVANVTRILGELNAISAAPFDAARDLPALKRLAAGLEALERKQPGG